MLKEKIAKAIKERLQEEYTEFTLEDYYEIVGWGRDCYLDFYDFQEIIKTEENLNEEITEITLQQLCEDAGVTEGDNYSSYTIDYFLENDKIYKRVQKEVTYRIIEE